MVSSALRGEHDGLLRSRTAGPRTMERSKLKEADTTAILIAESLALFTAGRLTLLPWRSGGGPKVLLRSTEAYEVCRGFPMAAEAKQVLNYNFRLCPTEERERIPRLHRLFRMAR